MYVTMEAEKEYLIHVCPADAGKSWIKCGEGKVFYIFTLFRPEDIIGGESSAIAGMLILLGGAAVLYVLGIMVFERKDLHI